MTIWVYRPNHPEANANGMVEKSRAFVDADGKQIHVISDIMPETRHMADGKYYTSKSEFRKATRAAGCVEVGNETATMLQPRKPIELSRTERREAIRKAFWMHRNGYRL